MANPSRPVGIEGIQQQQQHHTNNGNSIKRKRKPRIIVILNSTKQNRTQQHETKKTDFASSKYRGPHPHADKTLRKNKQALVAVLGRSTDTLDLEVKSPGQVKGYQDL